MLARCYCLNSLMSSLCTMSYASLPGAESSITPASLSWGMSWHFISPLIKSFRWWSTNLQKTSPKANQWKWLVVQRLNLGTELACSFVRRTALKRMPFSKNRTVGGIAAPADSLPSSFGTGQLIKLSAPGAPDYSQLFSRPKGAGDAGLPPHVRRSSSHTAREAAVGFISCGALPAL